MMRRSALVIVVLAGLCFFVLITTRIGEIVRGTAVAKAAQETRGPQGDTTANLSTAPPEILKVNGEWDLIWKDEANHFIRVSLTLEQTGPMLRVKSHGDQGIELTIGCCTKGESNEREVRFELHPRKAKPMLFAGHFINGILVGSTDTSLQWMAMPHLE